MSLRPVSLVAVASCGCSPRLGWWEWRGSSGVVDFEAVADGGGDRLEGAGVGAYDEVAAPQCAFDDAFVYGVGGGRACGEHAYGSGLGIVEGLDVASGQQPG